MKMNKREYAEAIAKAIGGEVQEVTKTNGIKLLGITKTYPNTNIAPNVYVDGFYDRKYSVEDAAKEIEDLIERNNKTTIDISEITDYRNAKLKLRARLYNNLTEAEVYKSAEEYGFDDLRIIPYVEVTMSDGTLGSSKVSKGLLEEWGITEDEVIETAMLNSSEFINIMSMNEIMALMMHCDVDELPFADETEAAPMYVISNDSKLYGAIGVILRQRTLKKMFPNGYAVLPSSVHEAIVVPLRDESDEADLTNMVQEVNASEVAPEEMLGQRAYIFK